MIGRSAARAVQPVATSLGAAYPRELLRVRDLIDVYRALPGDTGAFAATAMQGAIERALAAWESQDLLAILRAWADLRAWA